MKKLPLFFYTLVVILFGCKSTSYFKTPNDVLRKPGTIYFIDGTSKAGQISIQFEADIEVKNGISLKPTGSVTEERIPVRNVKAYTIDGYYYVPKEIDLYFTGTYNFLFIKRLTKENAKIQFYELHQAYKSNVTGEELYFYFISLPTHSQYEVWNIYSKNLVPYFDLKMSKIVEDCPALAEKIRVKQKGYFLPQLNLANSKKVAVFKRVIDEYNSCK